MDANEMFRKVLGVFACIFLVFGTTTNLLSCFICLKKSLRETPTFVFIAFMVVSDTLALYGLNLDWYFYEAFFATKLSDINWFYCKIHYFIHLFPLKTSAWLLVAMTIEAYLSSRVVTWRLAVFDSKKAAAVSITIYLIFIAVDFYANFINKFKIYYLPDNSILNSTCEEDEYLLNVWLTITTYGYSIVPFVLLSIFNFLLVYSTYTHKSKASAACKNHRIHLKSMTTIIAVRTLLFILCTAPVAIVGGYFLEYFRGTAWLSLFNSLRFSQHSFNFFVLIVFNRKFSDEINRMIHFRKKYLANSLRHIRTQNFHNIFRREY